MSKKKAFALRINEDMLKAIEKWAADNFVVPMARQNGLLIEPFNKPNVKKRKANTALI